MPKCKRLYADMEKYLAYRRRAKRAYRERTGSGSYEPRSWTQEEDRAVLAHEIPDRQLAEELGRSVSAVQVRRWRLRREKAHDRYFEE